MIKCNMAVGRFQPFTIGHLNMINEGDAPCIVYRINSSDKKIERKKKGIKIGSKSYNDESVNQVISFIDKPEGELSEQAKELLKRPFTNELIEKELEIVKKSNKNIIDVIPVVNMFEALARFNKFILDHQDEYEPQFWMCGDDRVDNYSDLIDKYDKLAIERGGEEYENVVKGKLKTNVGKGRTEGVSGTAVRASILNKDKSAFEKIMPKGVGSMFNDFVEAFSKFKEQLQGIIKEHKMLSLRNYIFEALKQDKTRVIVIANKYEWTEKILGNFISKKCSEDNSYWFSTHHIKPLLQMASRDEIINYLKKNQKKIVHPLFDYIQNEGTDGHHPKNVEVGGESIEESEFIYVLAQALTDYNLKKYIKL